MSDVLRQTQTDLKAFLIKLNKNLNILLEREAKYAGNAPLELLNQIDDHKQAIGLTRQAIAGEISQAEWCAAVEPLVLAVQGGQVVSIKADTYIAGDMTGDIIGGDKIITTIYEAPPAPLPPAEAKERRELNILLNKVKTFWIEGVLEKSIYNVSLVIGKEVQATAVIHPWEQVLELPDQRRQNLPPDKTISQVFDEMNRALLILGEPGSGKTMTLLRLARDLIDQARLDESLSQPVPVVFNLSTWTKDQTLLDWLIQELSAKYQIPERVGRPWLMNNRLLPLLDGLDEVTTEHQAACVEAINAFGGEFGLSGLVVCSRLAEYTRLPVRLKLNGAIRLQPLTLDRVYEYLGAAGSNLDTLRELLQKDEGLQELARSPLTLGVMRVAYQDLPVERLADPALNTVEAQRKHLFDTYIEQMFKHKGRRDKPFSDESTRNWLSWLARGMLAHHQSIFLIEQLQPSWIGDRPWFWLYMLSSRGVVGWLGGSAIAIVIGVLNQLIDPSIFGFEGELLLTAWPGLLLYWTSFGLAAGLIGGFIDGLRLKQRQQPATVENAPLRLRGLALNIFINGLIIGLVIGLGFGLFFSLPFGLLNGLLFGSIGGVLFGLRDSRYTLTRDIQAVEALDWSGEQALRFIPLGLAAGLFVGLGLLGLLVGLLDEQAIFAITGGPLLGLNATWTIGLAVELPAVLLGGLMGATFGGLQSGVLETKTRPNQGMRLSARNALFSGFGFGLIFGTAVSVIMTLIVGPAAGLGFGTAVGLYGGLLTAAWYGGLDLIYHYVLGLILWAKGDIPGPYMSFLDYATRRIFLQKVGGGYIFIHRLLLEHFAAMRDVETERTVSNRP